MKKEYRPPKFGKPGAKRRSAMAARTWITWVKEDAPEPETEAFKKKYEEAKAKQEEGDDEIGWISRGGKKQSGLFSNALPGDQLIIIDHSYKNPRVYAPVRVLAKSWMHKVDAKNEWFLFVEQYGDEFISLSAFRGALQKFNVAIAASGKANKQLRTVAPLVRLWK